MSNIIKDIRDFQWYQNYIRVQVLEVYNDLLQDNQSLFIVNAVAWKLGITLINYTLLYSTTYYRTLVLIGHTAGEFYHT